MKIYEIGTGYTPIPAQIGAATEIVVEELTKAFLKQNIPVEIIDIAADVRADTQLPIREVKVPKCFSGTDVHLGIMHKLKRVVYSISLAAELKRLLKNTEEKVILHFHNQYNLFFFLKLVPEVLRSRCVIAYTNHSGIWRLDWNEIKDTVQKRYFQEAECMKRADVVFVLNQETKNNVMEHLGIPEDRLVLISNGVNTDVYHPLPEEEKQLAKEKWGLDSYDVILQVGSVNENKGQLRTAENLLPLLKKESNLVFAYAGGVVDEAYHQQIGTFADENGLSDRIRYLGMVSPGAELNEVYNTAEVMLCASQYEGFSLAILEALSAGIPVLVDESSSFSVGQGCISGNLVSHLEDLIFDTLNQNENYEILCANARNNVLCNYSWNRIAEKYLLHLN